MSTRLDPPVNCRTTDHSDEIAAMRVAVEAIMATFPFGLGCPDELRKDTVILMASATLLKCHDDTGVSLDDWLGPRQLITEALLLIGLDDTTFLTNGV